MSNATWKQRERKVARALGGTRVGASGHSTPDVVTPWLAVECKQRKQLPLWLTTALSKIRAQAGDGKLGIVVLHEHGEHDSLVIMSLRDFADWFGDVDTTARHEQS